MPRIVLGPRIDPFKVARLALAILATDPAAAPDAAPVEKADVEVSFVGMQPDADPLVITLGIPTYDPASFNRLVAVSVVVLPLGHGEPTTPEGWLASSYPQATEDVGHVTVGVNVDVSIAGVPDGTFIAQVLRHFES